jgi:hypothetical protein
VQIQRPIHRLRKTATAIAASLALVHLGMFVLIYTLLNHQTALVRLGCCFLASRTCCSSSGNMPHHQLSFTHPLVFCCFLQVNDLGLMGGLLTWGGGWMRAAQPMMTRQRPLFLIVLLSTLCCSQQ